MRPNPQSSCRATPPSPVPPSATITWKGCFAGDTSVSEHPDDGAVAVSRTLKGVLSKDH
jgi:hypothetical protein